MGNRGNEPYHNQVMRMILISFLILFVDDTCLEVVYRMYWLCNHIHTYKKTTVYNYVLFTSFPLNYS